MADTDFLRELDNRITPKAGQVIRATGATNSDEFYSILEAFPSLATLDGFNYPDITNAIVQNGIGTFAEFAERLNTVEDASRLDHGMGAVAPSETRWPLGEQVAPPWETSFPEACQLEETAGGNIDVRGHCNWPVKDQGLRGTCVAFAVAALREAFDCLNQGTITPLSEQFLYWVTKNLYCHQPTNDGTWIKYALTALGKEGICKDTTWPYIPIPNPMSPGQSMPVHAAFNQALAWAKTGVLPSSTNASTVLQELQAGHPVAVSLPVFQDVTNPTGPNNWTTRVGSLYGIIVDPPPTSVVAGGHAVCVTGFHPDPVESTGGYFIIRNSWGTNWGNRLPNPASSAPAPGYGQVSATYIDKYLWEVAHL